MAASVDSIVLEALTRAMLDPLPRPLFGSKAKPGIFTSQGKGQKDAAQSLEIRGLVEKTDLIDPKTRKPLYRISTQGIAYALENAEGVQLLREVKDGVQRLLTMRDRIESTLKGFDHQQKILEVLLQRMMSPPSQQPVPAGVSVARQGNWLDSAVRYVQGYEREHPNQYCPLPAIYDNVVKATGASIGEFHDGIRRLAHDGRLRLHPYTRALYTIQGEEYALVAGQEIKYYAESLNGPAGS